MTLTAYPFDSQTVSETQYGDLFGSVAQAGIVGVPSSNHFKCTAAGSSMVVSVTAVGGASRALVRGHAVLNTASIDVTIPAANTTARADLIVLRLDYTANSISPVVRQGTAGSPTPPDPYWGTSGYYEIPLAVVAVGANATTISAGNVTDARRFTGPTIGVWSTNARPIIPLSFGFNVTTNAWEFTPDGTTWQAMGTVDLSGGGASGVLPVAKGGTGQTSLTDTRNALGIGGTTADPVPVANGGTGATARDGIRTGAIDLWVQPTAPAHSVGRLWIKTAS